MWVYLWSWQVQAGDIPQLQAGERLPNVGVRANCWTLRQGAGPDGVVARDELDPQGYRTAHCDLSGSAEWIRHNKFSPHLELLIRTGDVAVLARSDSDWVDAIPVGSRVTTQCWLDVVADYEWEAFELPDLRCDWTVNRLKLECRHRRDNGMPGSVISLVEINRMQAWVDAKGDPGSTRYLLDLQRQSQDTTPPL